MTLSRHYRGFALCALFSLMPALARAQAPAAPPPPAREGTAEFSFIGTTGNAPTQSLGLGGELILRPPTWVVRNKAAFVRNSTDGNLSAESFTYLFRTEKILSPRLSVFGQYGYFRDRFAGVDHRNDLLGGLAFTVVTVPKHRFVVDGGLGYLNEQRTVADEDVSSGTYSMGAAYKWTISDSADVTEDLRFLGVFAEASDWRLNQSLALAARITKLLSLKVSTVVRYTHLPPTGFKATDTVSGVSLVAKF